ncbi:MAG TPA: prepilin peptidase [Caulobacteraceae bacterium]
MIAWPVLALGACVGLCAGSFVTTAAIRAARGEAFLVGRSHCDACGVTLGFAATAPVVGYVATRGACAVCGGAIDRAHLFGEVAGAALLTGPFALLAWPQAALVAGLGLVLLAAGVFDLKTQRLPNRLTAASAALAAALAWTHGGPSLVTGVIAAAVTVVLLQGLRLGYARWRGETGLGFGDVKLLAGLALWLGTATPWAVVAASTLGLASMAVSPPKDRKLAFGPFIAAGAILVGVWKETPAWPLRP